VADDDLDWDDDDDDIGFEGDSGEQTLVDNLFIPSDVLDQVQSGLDWAQPGAEEQMNAEDKALAEEIRELDFFIKNGLKDAAETLLGELEEKYGQRPTLAQRRVDIDGM
jgi:hypothetical protein